MIDPQKEQIHKNPLEMLSKSHCFIQENVPKVITHWDVAICNDYFFFNFMISTLLGVGWDQTKVSVNYNRKLLEKLPLIWK